MEEWIVRGLLMVVVLGLFWLLMLHCWTRRRRIAVERLREHFQKQVYPKKELALALQRAEEKNGRSLQLRDLAKVHITPEQEKGSAYYARTSQLVCDGRRKGGETDAWYQEADWIRDIVAGTPMQRARMTAVKREKKKRR